MSMIRRLRRLAKWAGIALTAAAIYQEMSKPENERTWRGKVVGLVPYDFRPPTWDRIREAYWNPSDQRLFTERVFGVGWGLNLYRARVLLLRGFEQLMGNQEVPTPVRKYAVRARKTAGEAGTR
jgi:hypothetical protein